MSPEACVCLASVIHTFDLSPCCFATYGTQNFCAHRCLQSYGVCMSKKSRVYKKKLKFTKKNIY